MADVKGGCLQGGNSGRSIRTPIVTTASRYKGVQVFSYKELEEATDGFSEANVIGHGGFGVVYRGVLRDGTEAAIKMLHREGRQGERSFRVEVSDFIYYFLFLFAAFNPLFLWLIAVSVFASLPFVIIRCWPLYCQHRPIIDFCLYLYIFQKMLSPSSPGVLSKPHLNKQILGVDLSPGYILIKEFFISFLCVHV